MYAQKLDDMAPLGKAHLTSNSTSEEHQRKRKKTTPERTVAKAAKK